jgi:hypothetical protein
VLFSRQIDTPYALQDWSVKAYDVVTGYSVIVSQQVLQIVWLRKAPDTLSVNVLGYRAPYRIVRHIRLYIDHQRFHIPVTPSMPAERFRI